MLKIRTYISILIGICTGSLLYVVLNLIPIIGPLIVGFFAGKISNGGLRRGFFVGLVSGIVGYLLVFFVFSRYTQSWNILGIVFVGFLLTLWNFFAILLAGIGGIIGAIFSKKIRFEEFRDEEEKDVKTFVVCKNCKTANPKGEKYCQKCGEKL